MPVTPSRWRTNAFTSGRSRVASIRAARRMVSRSCTCMDLVDAISLVVHKRGTFPPELPVLVAEPETLTYDELQHTFARLIQGEHWKTLEVLTPVAPFAKAGAWVMDKVLGGDPFIRPWMSDRA